MRRIDTDHTQTTQCEKFYKLVLDVLDIADEFPFAYGDYFDWTKILITIPKDAHHHPLIHTLFLSQCCPVDVTRAYVKTQIASTDAWHAEWNATNFLPVYTNDNVSRISALDMVFLNGTVNQLTMILEDCAVHVWPYIYESLGFHNRHPLRVITAGAVPRSEQTKMALVLWDFIVRMSADASEHDDYLSREWLVWKRDPDALGLAVSKFETALEITVG